MMRTTKQHSEAKHQRMNDKFMQKIQDDPMFRRYCGLQGRDPTLVGKDRSTAGKVGPWNWLNADDRPPAQKPLAEKQEGEKLRNDIINNYAGSGYAAAPEIIDAWDLRLADNSEFEDQFAAWLAVKHKAWQEQRLGQ
eukprot:3923538-Alexandrium_andersonii.AAC.1